MYGNGFMSHTPQFCYVLRMGVLSSWGASEEFATEAECSLVLMREPIRNNRAVAVTNTFTVSKECSNDLLQRTPAMHSFRASYRREGGCAHNLMCCFRASQT